MTDYSKLKALAEAAIEHAEDSYALPSGLAFERAANPAAVLELIAEIDRRGERNVYWIDQANSIARDRNSIRSERDQLKAENEALRKDADRYRWLRDLATSQDLRYPLMGKPNEIDETIDAAMAQEQQP